MQDPDTSYARWLEGKLSEEELEALQKSGDLESLTAIVHAMDSLELSSLDRGASYERLKKKLPKTSAVAKPTGGARPWLWIILAACTTVALVWYLSTRAKGEVHMAQNGSIENINIYDGTVIQLNDGSTVKYSYGQEDQERLIQLTGEAYFNVQKGAPFIVSTENGSVRVLGTQFNVRAWGEDLYVECYEGSVQVTTSNQEESSVLTPGQAVKIKNTEMRDVQPIRGKLKPEWLAGSSRFVDESLTSVFDELQRQYDVNVEFGGSTQGFSGIFAHDDLEEALRGICLPLGLEWEISEDQKNISVR